MNRVQTIIVFAVCLLAAGLCSAVEPREGEGGFLKERPSWFVQVKTSEFPFPGAFESATAYGSGCWISRDLILTCWHNYKHTWNKPGHKHDRHYVVDHNGNTYDIKIEALDKKADLMVLRVTDEVIHTHTQVRLSDEDQASGHIVCYGMNRGGNGFRWTTGRCKVSEHGKPVRYGYGDRRLCWAGHTSFVCQGMSGGPAFNSTGEVCGVNINGEVLDDSTMITMETVHNLLSTVTP